MSHTPGPWVVDRSGDIAGPEHKWPRRQNEIGKVSATVVATVRNGNDGCYHFYPRETAEANARLIAAAPELLQMLEDCLIYVEECEQYHKQTERKQSKAIKEMLARFVPKS